MADLNQQEVQQLMQSFAQLSNSFQHGQRGVGDYADAQRQAANEIQSSFNNAAQQIRGAAIDYTKAMFSATEGTGKYAGAVSAAGNAAWEVGKNFGILGIAAGGLIKIFGDVAAASLKQNDALMRAYRDFADAGDLSGSFESVITNLNRIGLTSEQADDFRKVLDRVNPSLTSFGGGVSFGLKKYVSAVEGMIGVNNETELRMSKLGYSVQAMRESVAGYMKIQSTLGLSQTATTQSIQSGSEKYMVTLRELQELTGLSRDAAAKNVEQQLANYNWAVKLRELEIEDAKDGGDRAKSAMEFMGVGLDRYGQEAFAGMVSLAVNGGQAVDAAGAQFQQASRGEFMPALEGVILGVKKGGLSVDQGLHKLNDGILETGRIHGQTIKVMGDDAKSFTGGTQVQLGAMKYDMKSLGDAAGHVTSSLRQYSPRLTKNQLLDAADRALRISKDKALYMVGDSVVSSLSGLNSLLFQFGKMIARLLDTFGKILNLDMPAGGFSSQFKDREDMKEDVKQQEKEKAIIQSQLDSLKAIHNKQDLVNEIQKNKDKEANANAEINRIKKNADPTTGPVGRDLALINRLEQEKIILKEQKELLEEQKKNASNMLGVVDEEKLNAAIKEKQLKLEAELKAKEAQLARSKAEVASGSPFGSIPASNPGKSTNWKTDNLGQEANIGVQADRKIAQKGIADTGAEYDANDDKKQKVFDSLKFKNKEENNAGGKPTGALLALADQIKQFGFFTAMNDDFHKNKNIDPKTGKIRPSKHTEGKALDFVFNPDKAPANAEEAATYKEMFKGFGASEVRDEYFNEADDRSRGKHFHLEVARQGGLFSGPEDGFPVMLHGKKESVWNEKQMHALLEDVKKSSVDDYKQELMDQMGLNKTAPTPAIASGSNDVVMNMISLLSDKFDTLISISNQTKNIHDEILTYTRS